MVYKVNKADVVDVRNEMEVENKVANLCVDFAMMIDDENEFGLEVVKDLVVLDDVDVELVGNVHEDFQV
jgi:hypothetical protein